MITKPTLFVLGAGASKPYNFPTGGELVKSICSEPDAPEWLTVMGFDPNLFCEFKRALHYSAQPSIDAFLEHKPKYLELGKAAIAVHLVQRESSAGLMSGTDWYSYLLNRIAPSFDALCKNRLSIVTFNYDRSLEHFLFTGLTNRFDRSPDDIVAALKLIPIVHVHGQMGFLDWQAEKDGPSRAYDHGPRGPFTKENIVAAAEGIRIMSEHAGRADAFAEARVLFQQAERVYFLGFGFHRENVERLNPPFGRERTLCLGTSKGLTDTERLELHRRYKGLSLRDQDILTFLRSDPSFVEEEG